MKVIEDIKLDYNDVVIRPKSSSLPGRNYINLERHFEAKYGNSSFTVKPIFASNMDTVGTFEMAKALEKHNWMTCLHKHYKVDELVDFYYWKDGKCFDQKNAWYSMGITDADLSKLKLFIEAMRAKDSVEGWIPNICVDVANGYTDFFVDRVAEIREIVGGVFLMAGNVATPEMVERIIRQGKADIVKVGIGPGSACTTRLVTGVGYPMLSCVLECSDAAHGSSGGYICADGGCVHPGDLGKAFCANADFVMLGGMLAGCDECEGEWEYTNEVTLSGKTLNMSDDEIQTYFGSSIRLVSNLQDVRKIKTSLKFYGMSSFEAQQKYGGHKKHRASEGRVIRVPYKGPVEDTILDVEGGLNSSCTYIGAREIKHMGKCGTFIKVNRVHYNMER